MPGMARATRSKSLQRYPEALAAYEQALALDPKYVLAWHNKGTSL